MAENGFVRPAEQGDAAVSPLSADFVPHFRKVFAESPGTLSAKAFLATEQRFPGLGNGVLQDILFAARIHPKRKLRNLTEAERERLLSAVVSVLGEMTAQGGRDTEKDLFGRVGGYATKMSKTRWRMVVRSAAARSQRKPTLAVRSIIARRARSFKTKSPAARGFIFCLK